MDLITLTPPSPSRERRHFRNCSLLTLSPRGRGKGEGAIKLRGTLLKPHHKYRPSLAQVVSRNPLSQPVQPYRRDDDGPNHDILHVVGDAHQVTAISQNRHQ